MERNPAQRYHLYLIPEDVDLKDVVAFAYGDLIQPEVPNSQVFPIGDVDSLYMSDEKKSADNNMYRKTFSVEMR